MKNTSRSFLVASVLLAILATPSCRATTPDGTPIIPLIAHVAVDCTKTAVAETAKDIISEIEVDLISGNWVVLLAEAAKKFGEEAVACVIDYITNRSRLDAKASMDKATMAKIERGQKWLAERNIEIVKK